MSNFPEWVGNYRLERQIGKGGMSQVWLARHRTLRDRRVAVKLLLSQDAEWIDRFAREAEITSQLRHEHIVPIYDFGQQPPYYYTVMEYVAGGSLRDLLDQRGRLPLDLAARIFRSAAAALDYAHAHGVVHRDISTGNILVETNGERVLLSDFGIARETGKAQMTTVNKVMGTPGFLSPEHAASATAVTHLSDIYSLGVVLFVMLAGALPWPYTPGLGEGGGPFAPPMLLRDRGVTAVPADVDDVIRTMLALEPPKRFPSAKAAIEALDKALRRHNSTTQIATVAPVGTPPDPPPPEEPHPVEQVLAADLIKAPMQEAQNRSNELNDPRQIAELLNRWSRERPFQIRRPALGRQAAIRRVIHRNVYNYTLRVLYETREPAKTAEEPDYKASASKLERELDRWEVTLSTPKGFDSDAGGVVRVPGSTRVVKCEACNGIGRTICPRCNGRQRIAAPQEPKPQTERPASGSAPGATVTAAPVAPPAPALIPCPECSGVGGLHCNRCDGVSRLIVHKTVRWSRKASTYNESDDLPRVDEQWLRKNCRSRDVYREEARGGFRAEWQLVPLVQDQIRKAEAALPPDSRIVLSELTISFIPVTEIVFDLDEPTVSGKGKPKTPSLYRWNIYGFERRLPNDWRFLNWDRALAIGAIALAIIASLLLILELALRT